MDIQKIPNLIGASIVEFAKDPKFAKQISIITSSPKSPGLSPEARAAIGELYATPEFRKVIQPQIEITPSIIVGLGISYSFSIVVGAFGANTWINTATGYVQASMGGVLAPSTSLEAAFTFFFYEHQPQMYNGFAFGPVVRAELGLGLGVFGLLHSGRGMVGVSVNLGLGLTTGGFVGNHSTTPV